MFEAHGAVQSAQVVMDRDTGRSKGFGFVEMETGEAAQAAISALNGQDFAGRSLTVNEARPREERGGGRRRSWRLRRRRWWWRRPQERRRRWWWRRLRRSALLSPFRQPQDHCRKPRPSFAARQEKGVFLLGARHCKRIGYGQSRLSLRERTCFRRAKADVDGVTKLQSILRNCSKRYRLSCGPADASGWYWTLNAGKCRCRIPATVLSFRLRCVISNSAGSVGSSTAKPWF